MHLIQSLKNEFCFDLPMFSKYLATSINSYFYKKTLHNNFNFWAPRTPFFSLIFYYFIHQRVWLSSVSAKNWNPVSTSWKGSGNRLDNTPNPFLFMNNSLSQKLGTFAKIAFPQVYVGWRHQRWSVNFWRKWKENCL